MICCPYETIAFLRKKNDTSKRFWLHCVEQQATVVVE
jgi:hypothetical protein